MRKEDDKNEKRTGNGPETNEWARRITENAIRIAGSVAPSDRHLANYLKGSGLVVKLSKKRRNLRKKIYFRALFTILSLKSDS